MGNVQTFMRRYNRQSHLILNCGVRCRSAEFLLTRRYASRTTLTIIVKLKTKERAMHMAIYT